jgi:hypothetical protein
MLKANCFRANEQLKAILDKVTLVVDVGRGGSFYIHKSEQ